jgi:hypothetical protein
MAPLEGAPTRRTFAAASPVAWSLGFLIFALGAAFSGPADAELFRCTGPDGRTVFTDCRATCPGADEYEPSGAVQKISRDSGSTPAAPMPRRLSTNPSTATTRAGEKADWQRRKSLKQQELDRLEARTADLKGFLIACNRGADIVRRDETGIKYRVPCEQIRKEHDDGLARLPRLREYLESGLARECRRAGCLPGWIR